MSPRSNLYARMKRDMIKELDTVVLTHDIPANGLVKGGLGAVVHMYQDRESYEVEFATEGKTVAVPTLTSQDIGLMRPHEILHARELQAV